MDPFVHLETQSAYSFLWGAFTPENLVSAVAVKGQGAVALTDSHSLHGAVRFYLAARRVGVQPIIGARVRLWEGSWITLLARDFAGYQNLSRLLSASLAAGGEGPPRLLRTALCRSSKGLICLAGGRDSRIRALVRQGKIEAAGIWLLLLRELFPGLDRLFVVLQHHGLLKDEWMMTGLAALAKRLGLPLVATNAVTFLSPEDFVLHRTLVGIQQRHHHREVRPLPNDRFFLVSSREMGEKIPYPEALANTWRIAELCRGFTLPVRRLHPPHFRPGPVAERDLAKTCLRELARRYRPVEAAYLRELDSELRVIKGKGLSDFFLLVREVVEFAQEMGIRHSVRGSAAGSLVVHLLLGGVDPVTHGLLFERFINEGRGDMPDIDIDFDSERRDEVIRWLMDRFPGQTAMVATIHTFRVRSAVRLAARALGYSLAEIKRLSTCLPWSLRGLDLATALERLPELRGAPIQQEPRLLDLASRLFGLPFQASVHLGGVILAPGEIAAWTPISLSAKAFPVGQLDKDDVDVLGLLKLDLLGLRMHTALRSAQDALKAQGKAVNLEALPLNDPATYELLRTTESLGVFQLESPGQRHLLGRLQPQHFSDLVAEISLFRPGPVEGNMVAAYVRRRQGQEAVRILHPDLAPILAETYGVIVFQEQVLRIVHAFSGLSYAEADAFRRAMTKDRSPKEMTKLKEQFISGAIAKGHSRGLAEAVFRQVTVFAAYGFCKAHAVSFAHITYQSAWLKAHHPQAFYLGLLNAGHVGSYPAFVILNEARRQGIPVYPPQVNASGLTYEAEVWGIRAPLGVIRGIGPKLAERIVAKRESGGPFTSWEDFFVRVPFPARARAVLIMSGALEGLPLPDPSADTGEELVYVVAG